MNIFVLSTGRCGSKTFCQACTHMTNYTSGHEINNGLIGNERLKYSENHIESDNRLSWMLGRLDKVYGNDAFYVHLIREKKATAESFNQRWMGNFLIIKSYSEGILNRKTQSIKECLDYYDTVNSNISLFLKDKENKMTIRLEEIEEKFPEFWNKINARGDLESALEELKIKHNKTKSSINSYIEYYLWRLKEQLANIKSHFVDRSEK